MIVDQFGHQARPSVPLIVPDWMLRQLRAFGEAATRRLGEQRARDLRSSILGPADPTPLVGSTVRVRLPKRYAAGQPRESA